MKIINLRQGIYFFCKEIVRNLEKVSLILIPKLLLWNGIFYEVSTSIMWKQKLHAILLSELESSERGFIIRVKSKIYVGNNRQDVNKIQQYVNKT